MLDINDIIEDEVFHSNTQMMIEQNIRELIRRITYNKWSMTLYRRNVGYLDLMLRKW
jgi:hypothetical protein